PSRVRLASGKMTRLVPESIASCVKRHMRFKSDCRRTSGTGTFPKRFINQPYAGILKCDSSSQPRTNCGMAQYRIKGSNRLTWFEKKNEVRLGSKPAERRTSTVAPERKAMRRHKPRCSRSCLRGSRKNPRNTSTGTTRKKCKALRIHRSPLRKANHAFFIETHPPQREERRGSGIPAWRLPHQS